MSIKDNCEILVEDSIGSSVAETMDAKDPKFGDDSITCLQEVRKSEAECLSILVDMGALLYGTIVRL